MNADREFRCDRCYRPLGDDSVLGPNGRSMHPACAETDRPTPQDLPIDRRPREQAAVARAGGPPRVGGSSRLERKLEAEASQEVLDVLTLLRHSTNAHSAMLSALSSTLDAFDRRLRGFEKRIADLEKRPRAGKRSKPRSTR